MQGRFLLASLLTLIIFLGGLSLARLQIAQVVVMMDTFFIL